MQLSSQEPAAAFWEGAKRGTIRSLGYIAAVAVPVVALMALHILPAVTITVGIISALSTALTVGMFSGHTAVMDYHQKKHNALYEAKFARLEGRAVPEQEDIVEQPAHSPRLSTILEHGARKSDLSFAETEEGRSSAPTTPTIH